MSQEIKLPPVFLQPSRCHPLSLFELQLRKSMSYGAQCTPSALPIKHRSQIWDVFQKDRHALVWLDSHTQTHTHKQAFIVSLLTIRPHLSVFFSLLLFVHISFDLFVVVVDYTALCFIVQHFSKPFFFKSPL